MRDVVLNTINAGVAGPMPQKKPCFQGLLRGGGDDIPAGCPRFRQTQVLFKKPPFGRKRANSRALMTYFLALLATVFSSVQAQPPNPLYRVCVHNGGQFVVLEPGQRDDRPVCVFGQASIGAIDLVKHVDHKNSLSIRAFLNAKEASDVATVCERNEVPRVKGHNPRSVPYELCQFSDERLEECYIDAATLARGANAPENARLKAVLEHPVQ
jgi:hypothetical protein